MDDLKVARRTLPLRLKDSRNVSVCGMIYQRKTWKQLLKEYSMDSGWVMARVVQALTGTRFHEIRPFFWRSHTLFQQYSLGICLYLKLSNR